MAGFVLCVCTAGQQAQAAEGALVRAHADDGEQQHEEEQEKQDIEQQRQGLEKGQYQTLRPQTAPHTGVSLRELDRGHVIAGLAWRVPWCHYTP